MEYAEKMVVRLMESYLFAFLEPIGLLFLDRKRDRYSPRKTRSEMLFVSDALVIFAAHKSGERRESADSYHFEIGYLSCVKFYALHIDGFSQQLFSLFAARFTIDERASM